MISNLTPGVLSMWKTHIDCVLDMTRGYYHYVESRTVLDHGIT